MKKTTTKTILVCDRCGVEGGLINETISALDPFYLEETAIKIESVSHDMFGNGAKSEHELLLCGDCSKKLYKFLRIGQ